MPPKKPDASCHWGTFPKLGATNLGQSFTKTDYLTLVLATSRQMEFAKQLTFQMRLLLPVAFALQKTLYYHWLLRWLYKPKAN